MSLSLLATWLMHKALVYPSPYRHADNHYIIRIFIDKLYQEYVHNIQVRESVEQLIGSVQTHIV